MIKQSNVMLLEIARQPNGAIEDFQLIIDQLKEYSYLVQLQMLHVKGYDEKL